jgi:hypothetical protein
MLHLDVLPARHGDCLWLEYGEADRPCRILIDGGPGFAYAVLRERIARLAPEQRYFDLVVVTHIDGDHIEGVIKMLRDRALGLSVHAIWFNGSPQIATIPVEGAMLAYGGVQGEYLGKLIRELKIPWNVPFGGKAATAGATVELPCSARVVLLSPMLDQLVRLRRSWDAELAKAGVAPDATEAEMARLAAIIRLRPPQAFAGPSVPDVDALAAQPFEADSAIANGSSIALLFEFGGKRLLLLGDAFSDVIAAQLDMLLANTGEKLLHADLVKLPHHGSRANLGPSLMEKLMCERWVISSDGKYFNHPDAEAIARVIRYSRARATLMFNYRTAWTAPWSDVALQERFAYGTLFPQDDGDGLHLRILE